MPKILLSVSHHQQRTLADCLPVCVQIVTDYHGLQLSYDELVRVLGTRPFGTPFRNIRRLESKGISVRIEHLGLAEIASYLQQNLPVVVCVNTARLSYWSQSVDHVVVVAGIDEAFVYLHDPSFPSGPERVPHVEFELAQLEYDNLCAVLGT